MHKSKKITTAVVKALIPPQIVRQQLPKRAENSILLTFDDGPHPDITPRVLNVLDKYKARALFFILGSRVDKVPELLKEIIERGHKIGNHTYSHQRWNNFSLKEYKEDIFKCQEKIFNITGERPEYFRPPYGQVTLPIIMVTKLCKMKCIRWSIEIGEYSYMKKATVDEMSNNLIKNIKHRDIVLTHDDHEQIPIVLENVLPKLIEKGLNLNNGVNYLG